MLKKLKKSLVLDKTFKDIDDLVCLEYKNGDGLLILTKKEFLKINKNKLDKFFKI